MADFKKKQDSRVKKIKKRGLGFIIGVDVWRKEFGYHSVEAILKLYSQEFDVRRSDIRSRDFSKCIDALRKLEKPDYVAPK